jgi:hypothetical protein
MNTQEAVEALKNNLKVYLVAQETKDGRIYGSNKHSFEEVFFLKPLGQDSDLWSGDAEYCGLYCDFPARPLDQLVDDICDLYASSCDQSMSPSDMMTLLLRLTEQGFFVRYEQTAILGSLRMNFAANNFWLRQIGDFYVANDFARVNDFATLSGPGSSPTIICSRSIDTVIECLTAYYGDSSQR